MGKFKDIQGQRFNNLTVLNLSDKTNRGFWWICKCDCGNEVRVLGSNIIRGHSKSCGCIRAKASSDSHYKHGMINTRIYKIWVGIKTRCTDVNSRPYKNYGGRGITICDKWMMFEGFYEDMGSGYSDNLSIDRVDNNKGYSKENCKWSTRIEQANNVRNNHIVVVDGITDTLANMSRRYNINYKMAAQRIKLGWDIDKVFKTPKLR